MCICDVWMHLLYMRAAFCCLCFFLLAVWFRVCFQLIEVVTTHPHAPSLSHTLINTHACPRPQMTYFAKPDSSIPPSLSRIFWTSFGPSLVYILHNNTHFHQFFISANKVSADLQQLYLVQPFLLDIQRWCHAQYASTTCTFVVTALWSRFMD